MQLNWREVESRAPCKISRHNNAVVNKEGNLCIIYEGQVYKYCKNHWSDLPIYPYDGCSIAIVNDLLTAVGGFQGSNITNQLFSLTGKGSDKRWTEEFPPMPTK